VDFSPMRKLHKEDEAFLKKIGDRIVQLRKEAGITQVELGDRCDIEKPNMRRIEAGQTNATILTLRKISKALNIPVSEILNFD